MLELAREHVIRTKKGIAAQYSMPTVDQEAEYLDAMASNCVLEGEILLGTLVGVASALNIHKSGISKCVTGWREKNSKRFLSGLAEGFISPIVAGVAKPPKIASASAIEKVDQVRSRFF